MHAGAVIVPAVLAACERHNRGRRGGAARHRGRRRGAVPAQPRGAEGGAQGGLPSDRGVRRDGRGGRRRGGARSSTAKQTVDALGIAGSMASGIIEYLAEGAWTKRMHAGWAAQSGLRAALLARAGFSGPRTVFEGTHGLFHGFAHTTDGNYDALTRRFRHALGDRDARLQALSVRDHDASLHRLRAAARRARHQAGGHRARSSATSARARCIGCGSRSPPSRRPRTATRAKFSQPYCIAAGARARQCGPRRLHRRGREGPARARARREGPLPDRSGTIPIRTTSPATSARRLRDGSVIEERQPHLRGGAQEPLTRADIEDKFVLNCRHGGWDDGTTKAALRLAQIAVRWPIDLKELRGERPSKELVRPRRAGHRRGAQHRPRDGASRSRRAAPRSWSTCARTRREAERSCARSSATAARRSRRSPTSATSRRCSRWWRTRRSSSAASTTWSTTRRCAASAPSRT